MVAFAREADANCPPKESLVRPWQGRVAKRISFVSRLMGKIVAAKLAIRWWCRLVRVGKPAPSYKAQPPKSWAFACLHAHKEKKSAKPAMPPQALAMSS